MRTSTIALGLTALLSGAAHATYTLSTTYDSTNFFSEFDFYDETDPTDGFVEYVDETTAEANGLASIKNSSIYMGVDSTTLNPTNGRQSVRVTSQQSWTHGLFIADIAHMPGSICGAWPAMWLTKTSDWPNSGEIDIIEGVNTDTTDTITLHTSAGCTIDNDGSLSTTTLSESDCNDGDAGTGCGQDTADNQNYGDGFNDIGGGVYATEWTSDYIAVWFFARGSIPSDISSGSPDPTGWGTPIAKFNGGSGCDIDDHFASNNLIFDTTFCGDWAGDVWSSNSECSALASTCEDYVSANPSAFAEAYWLINSIDVYQDNGATASTTPSSSSSTPTPTAVAATTTITTTATTTVNAWTAPTNAGGWSHGGDNWSSRHNHVRKHASA